jgi:hypothetical protein
MKKLVLKRESLTELTQAELGGVVGGVADDSYTCPITYGCVSYQSCNVTAEINKILGTTP